MSNQKNRIVAIVQARMGATRLPGKPMKMVLGKPLLWYELERIRQAKSIDQIVVATTTHERDETIADICNQEKVPVFKGSEHDVLDRYYQAAKAFHADIVIRITGDCPVIDPEIVDRAVDNFLSAHPPYDYLSNSLQRTYPRGLDVEVFSFKALEKAHWEAKQPEEREHVTLYMYEHPEKFRLGSMTNAVDESHHRWTVDTEEDFQLIAKIIGTLYPVKRDFNFQDILGLFRKHPEWKEINAHIKQKPLR